MAPLLARRSLRIEGSEQTEPQTSEVTPVFPEVQYLYIQLMARIEKVRSDETGATAVEYGMIVALIAAVIVAIVTTLGTQINAAFTKVSGKL